MTPSGQAKNYGCKSLEQVSQVSGISKQTLINWFAYRRFVFDAVCKAVAANG